jgi:phosphoribosylaminoimidazolecarboxamide formyltransferase/IMP cyclohydrolase
VRYIEGDFTTAEKPIWLNNFDQVPEMLTEAEKADFMLSLKGVSISSDAFFPFRDSIDHASKVGVEFVAQAGGSVADNDVIAACNEYKMSMAFTNLRLFHH